MCSYNECKSNASLSPHVTFWFFFYPYFYHLLLLLVDVQREEEGDESSPQVCWEQYTSGQLRHLITLSSVSCPIWQLSHLTVVPSDSCLICPKGAQTPPNDMIILDKYCQQLGVYVSWRVGLVNVHFVICILVLDIYCNIVSTCNVDWSDLWSR